MINLEKMNNHIYAMPGSGALMGEDCGESNRRNDIENKFVLKIADIVCDVFDINHNERRIVSPLLIRALKDSLNSRSERDPGMLQQYLAHELEIVAKCIRSDLKIPEDVKVNHAHVTRAKFSDIISYITENWVRIEDIHSDGTFDKINDRKPRLTDEVMEPQCQDDCECESAG